MKKILGLVVAVAFALTATVVLAEEAKKADTTKAPVAKETVKAVEKTTATGTTTDKIVVKEKAPGVKEEIKAVEKTTAAGKVEEKVVVKATIDPKAECLAKFKGKTEKDAEVQKCISDAKNIAKKSEVTKTAMETKPALEKKATDTTKAPVEKKATEAKATTEKKVVEPSKTK